MIFAAFPLDEAIGAVVAHSHHLPGRMLKKGSVFDQAAIATLREVACIEVVAARLEPGDVAGNESAERIAALDVPNPASVRAGTGRVNLHAVIAGLLRIDAAAVDRIKTPVENRILAALPDASVMAPGTRWQP